MAAALATGPRRCLSAPPAVVWFANSFGYYGLSLDTASLGGSAYVNLLLSSLAEVPALPLTSWLLDKIGRRTTTIALMLFAGACCAVGVFLPTTAAFHIVRVAAFSAGKFAVAGSFGALYVYGVELFPTCARAPRPLPPRQPWAHRPLAPRAQPSAALQWACPARPRASAGWWPP